MTSRSREMRGDLRKEGAGEEEDAAGGGGEGEGRKLVVPVRSVSKPGDLRPGPGGRWRSCLARGVRPLNSRGGNLFDRRY